jgi:hypothetical protein
VANSTVDVFLNRHWINYDPEIPDLNPFLGEALILNPHDDFCLRLTTRTDACTPIALQILVETQ